MKLPADPPPGSDPDLAQGAILLLTAQEITAGIRGGNWLGYLDKRHCERAQREANEQGDPTCDENVYHAQLLRFVARPRAAYRDRA